VRDPLVRDELNARIHAAINLAAKNPLLTLENRDAKGLRALMEAHLYAKRDTVLALMREGRFPPQATALNSEELPRSAAALAY
jgi:hypothetical protein